MSHNSGKPEHFKDQIGHNENIASKNKRKLEKSENCGIDPFIMLAKIGNFLNPEFRGCRAK